MKIVSLCACLSVCPRQHTVRHSLTMVSLVRRCGVVSLSIIRSASIRPASSPASVKFKCGRIYTNGRTDRHTEIGQFKSQYTFTVILTTFNYGCIGFHFLNPNANASALSLISGIFVIYRSLDCEDHLLRGKIRLHSLRK